MKRYQKCIKGNGNAGKKDLIGLKKIELKRYIKIILISLHSFSDVFGLGYGEGSYLRLVDECKHTYIAHS